MLPNVRLFGWNFYSRLSSVSLNTTLSQSSFDSKALQRKSPWSSTNFWLSSPIHDYSFFISSLFSVKTVVLPEMFFQFKKKHDFSSDFWSQLFFRFWTNFVEVSKFSTSQFSLFFFFKSDFLNFYFVLRWFLKLSLSFSPIFSWRWLRTHRRLFLGKRSSSVLYGSLSLPVISLQLSRPLSKASWNSLSIFPNQMLYMRYLRRHFCFSPLFVNYSIRLEERILDLNFFLTFFFQSHSINCSMQFYQRVFLWFFFL